LESFNTFIKKKIKHKKTPTQAQAFVVTQCNLPRPYRNTLVITRELESESAQGTFVSQKSCSHTRGFPTQ